MLAEIGIEGSIAEFQLDAPQSSTMTKPQEIDHSLALKARLDAPDVHSVVHDESAATLLDAQVDEEAASAPADGERTDIVKGGEINATSAEEIGHAGFMDEHTKPPLNPAVAASVPSSYFANSSLQTIPLDDLLHGLDASDLDFSEGLSPAEDELDALAEVDLPNEEEDWGADFATEDIDLDFNMFSPVKGTTGDDLSEPAVDQDDVNNVPVPSSQECDEELQLPEIYPSSTQQVSSLNAPFSSLKPTRLEKDDEIFNAPASSSFLYNDPFPSDSRFSLDFTGYGSNKAPMGFLGFTSGRADPTKPLKGPSEEALRKAAKRMFDEIDEVPEVTNPPSKVPSMAMTVTPHIEGAIEQKRPRVVLGGQQIVKGQNGEASLEATWGKGNSEPTLPKSPAPVKFVPSVASLFASETPEKQNLIKSQPHLNNIQFPRPSTPLQNSSQQQNSHFRPSVISTPGPSSTPLLGGRNPLPRRVGIGGLGISTPRTGMSKKGGSSFKTPFKTSSALSQSPTINSYGSPVMSRRQLPDAFASSSKAMVNKTITPSLKGKERAHASVFSLAPPPEGRKTLRQSYLRPEFYSKDELKDLDIPEEIYAINPENGLWYSFNDPNLEGGQLDCRSVLKELIDAGCEKKSLTAEWIENHWVMILWKLACEIRSRPILWESGLWSWEEVIRQFKYRYEREYNLGHRSCVKLIQERDVSPATSMVLCVSKIDWVPLREGTFSSHPVGTPVPIFELTDGWYKIKAEGDDVLMRAVTRGKLALGTKIGCIGAKLDARGDSTTVLLSLNNTMLSLTGNSTSLAAWDAKLGFQKSPFLATLASLSPDGGMVGTLDIVVLKVFPLAFMDVVPREETVGAKPSPAVPRGEKEEFDEQEKWKERCAAEQSLIEREITKRLDNLVGLGERVELMANSGPASSDNMPPEIEDIFDDLYSAVDKKEFLSQLKQSDLRFLAIFIKIRIDEERASAQAEMQNELRTRCPPREVRSFRIVRFKDHQTKKHPSGFRTAQLTIWDAASFGEDGLREGSRYIVSNLVPGQKSSWPPGNVEGDVYLNTRRDTQWRSMSY